MDKTIEMVLIVITLSFGFVAFLLTLSEISLLALPREKAKSLLPILENRKKLLGFFDFIRIMVASFYFCFLTIFSLFSMPTFYTSNTPHDALLGLPWSGTMFLLTFLSGTVLYAALFQFFPRRWALYHVEKFSRTLGPAVAILFRLLGWVPSFLDGFAKLLTNLFGREPRSKKLPLSGEEIKMLVSLGNEEPLEIEKEEKEMIESVMTFGQTTVKEIMTPRIDMVCVEAVTPVSGVTAMAISHGYSKFPVYAETIDNIVGIVYIKDLYRFLHDAQSATPLREMMRKPFFVPESKKVDDLLREMQKDKISMAIIVDEYGGTDGLVTVEDIVEEIVGEIADEHDTQIPDILPLSEKSWLVDGQINLEDLNEKLHLSLPTEEFETLSGYVYGLMGKVPKVGDKIETENEILEVMVVHRQRISKVKLTQKTPLEKEKMKEELS